jgi:hypothetical protein
VVYVKKNAILCGVFIIFFSDSECSNEPAGYSGDVNRNAKKMTGHAYLLELLSRHPSATAPPNNTNIMETNKRKSKRKNKRTDQKGRSEDDITGAWMYETAMFGKRLPLPTKK